MPKTKSKPQDEISETPGGWIKLWRRLKENALMQEPRLLQVFIYCLLSAVHEETKFVWNGKELILKPGQFITGRTKANKSLKLKSIMFDRKLKILENIGIVNRQANNKFSIITIVNWEEYQGRQKEMNSKMNNRRTTNEHIQEGIKNVKNNSNNKDLIAVASQISRILKGKITKENVLAEIQGQEPGEMVKIAQEVVERSGVKNPAGLFLVLAREEKTKGQGQQQGQRQRQKQRQRQRVDDGVFIFIPDEVLGIVKEKLQGEDLEKQLWTILDKYHEKFYQRDFHKYKDELSESEIEDMVKVAKKFAVLTAK